MILLPTESKVAAVTKGACQYVYRSETVREPSSDEMSMETAAEPSLNDVKSGGLTKTSMNPVPDDLMYARGAGTAPKYTLNLEDMLDTPYILAVKLNGNEDWSVGPAQGINLLVELSMQEI